MVGRPIRVVLSVQRTWITREVLSIPFTESCPCVDWHGIDLRRRREETFPVRAPARCGDIINQLVGETVEHVDIVARRMIRRWL